MNLETKYLSRWNILSLFKRLSYGASTGNKNRSIASIRDTRKARKLFPVLNYVPRHEDVWGVELQLHAFLNSEVGGCD
jgi:hypothetical protein